MKKVWMAIIVLICLVIFQANQIYKKTYSGYMFDYHYNMERVNIDYVVLSYNLLTIKHMIPVSKETVLSVFVNDIDKKYNTALQYWFNKRNFYPITMPREHNFVPLLDYSSKKFSNSIEKNKNDYVVFVGKGSTMLNVTTKKDISLYKVINKNELELIYDFDNTLFSLRENSKKINKNEYFNDTISYIDRYIKNYSYLYGISAYEYAYGYANDLKQNNELNEANKYYNIYLSMNQTQPNVLLNKAQIYGYYKDYDNAKFMIDYCKTLTDCDIQLANQIESDLEVKE